MEPVMARDEEDKAQWKDEGGAPSAEMPPRGGVRAASLPANPPV